MSLKLSKNAINKNIYHRNRHVGPRSGISCFYQREEISLRVQKKAYRIRDDALLWTAILVGYRMQ